MDEYAAAYLLDPQEAAWTYQHICRQAAKNYIALKAAGDIDGFASLLEASQQRIDAREPPEVDIRQRARNSQWRVAQDTAVADTRGSAVLACEVRLAELPDPFIQIWIDGSVRGSMLFGKASWLRPDLLRDEIDGMMFCSHNSWAEQTQRTLPHV